MVKHHVEVREIAFTADLVHDLRPEPHLHTHLEMVYILEGKNTAVVDNREYALEEGSLFLTFPNQVHFYLDRAPLKAYLIIFSPEVLPELHDTFQSVAPVTPVLCKEAVPVDTAAALEKIRISLLTSGQFSTSIAKGQLLSLVGEFLTQSKLLDRQVDPDTAKRVLDYCLAHYTQPLSLEKLSRDLYLNKYYISHLFQEKMHIRFTEYIHGLRVELACDMLKKQVPITQVAFACGFSSVRTFNRVFLQRTGMTPRAFIAQYHEEE